MLTNVSLSVTPSERGCRLIHTMGGLRPAPVKNEIGARLAIPSFDKVLIQPMARGRILPMRSLGVDRVECCAIDNHVTPFFNFVRVYWNELSSAAQDFGRWPTGVLDSSKLKVP